MGTQPEEELPEAVDFFAEARHVVPPHASNAPGMENTDFHEQARRLLVDAGELRAGWEHLAAASTPTTQGQGSNVAQLPQTESDLPEPVDFFEKATFVAAADEAAEEEMTMLRKELKEGEERQKELEEKLREAKGVEEEGGAGTLDRELNAEEQRMAELLAPVPSTAAALQESSGETYQQLKAKLQQSLSRCDELVSNNKQAADGIDFLEGESKWWQDHISALEAGEDTAEEMEEGPHEWDAPGWDEIYNSICKPGSGTGASMWMPEASRDSANCAMEAGAVPQEAGAVLADPDAR